MKINQIFFSAYQALNQNLRRSLLTMIGIIIGVASIITILSLGKGFQNYAIKNLTKKSSNVVSAKINFSPNNFDMINSSDLKYFNEFDLLLAQSVEGVRIAKYSDTIITSGMQEFQFKTGKYNKMIGYKKKTDGPMIMGSNFSEIDNNNLRKVAVINETTAKEISSDYSKVIGFGLNIDGELYTIIGIQKSENSANLFSLDNDISIPKKTYESYQVNNRPIIGIVIEIQKNYKPTSVANNVVKKLSENGSMSSQGTYSTIDMSELLDGISKILSTLTYFISGVAGISLFIAGVGVMNMMYTSVSERTQEIGVRRAMGAKKSDIRIQFLAEGLLITISSGFIGYFIGFLVAFIISQFLPFMVSPDFFTISLAIGVTTMLGLVFSVAPANAAANKELVEILR